MADEHEMSMIIRDSDPLEGSESGGELSDNERTSLPHLKSRSPFPHSGGKWDTRSFGDVQPRLVSFINLKKWLNKRVNLRDKFMEWKTKWMNKGIK